jgi:hypothetical protein
MGKLIVLVVIVGAAYWYWSGPYQLGRVSPLERALQDNARDMERCVRRESSMNAAAGMAGGAVSGADNEALCAEKLGLYRSDGQWHRAAASGAR